MTRNLQRRVERLELRNQPPAAVVVCFCGVPDGQHTADCPAAGAGDNDTVFVLCWPDDPVIPGSKVIQLHWDDDNDD